MTNDLQQRAETFAEDCDLYNDPVEAMADFAAAEIARERAEIVAELDAIGKSETCYADYSDAIGDYIETLRAKL